jgi:two-component system heavy metal sensor histidine kinase CusS
MKLSFNPGRGPWSLTARLITLQMLAMTVLLGGTLVAIYYNISGHLEADNRDEFASEIRLLSRWMEDTQDDLPDNAAEAKEHTNQLATLPVFVRLLGSDGTVRFENRPQPDFPPAIFPPPGQEPVLWRTPDHHRYLLGTARLKVPAGGRGVWLQMAYDVSDDDTLLRHLRQRMGLVFGLIIALSGLLAWLIARGVFRPLAQLTAAAARIHASQLHARIDEAGWPAELTTLAREFDAMLARLDESFRRLARFSSDLSHELRTPINNLRGEAEVALSRPRSADEYRRVLESSLEECARLGRLIDTLLFIAKADHPAQGILRRTLDAAAECHKVAEFFEAAAAERGLTILVRGSAPVHCDAELLRRALANLLDNAARHTAAGGHIDLTVRESAGRGTEIEVQDNGAGIPSEHLPRVFERFYRSEKGPGEVHATSGFGLGLAIVKSIMDLHGGTVELASVPGSGTTVTLFFPAAS